MTVEAVEGEVLEAESRALTISGTVALPITVEEAIRQWGQYQELTRQLLDDSDYQQIGGKRFKKKSAWRKYARAFNITDRVTFEEIARSDDGFPIFARLRVEARALNGRTAEADQECHVRERCCKQPCEKASWNNHACCPAECDGKRHWSHPGDLPATALTRAKNRAISDLIGAGEVSAEEMEGTERPPQTQVVRQRKIPQVAPPSCPDHGLCKFVPGGVSKQTQKPYRAFYTCRDGACKRGSKGKGFYVDAEEWETNQRQLAATRDEPVDPDEGLPHE